MRAVSVGVALALLLGGCALAPRYASTGAVCPPWRGECWAGSDAMARGDVLMPRVQVGAPAVVIVVPVGVLQPGPLYLLPVAPVAPWYPPPTLMRGLNQR